MTIYELTMLLVGVVVGYCLALVPVFKLRVRESETANNFLIFEDSETIAKHAALKWITKRTKGLTGSIRCRMNKLEYSNEEIATKMIEEKAVTVKWFREHGLTYEGLVAEIKEIRGE